MIFFLYIIVDESIVGTAFGFAAVLYNIGLIILPFTIGWLRHLFGSYNIPMLLLASCCVAAFFSSIGMIIAYQRSKKKTTLETAVN
jgi:nitrate/nitrite transporter NarK